MAYTASPNPISSHHTGQMETGAHNAYTLLRIGFVILPIVAGADKFMRMLTDWDKYLAPMVTDMLHVSARTFMMAVGVIEILAGLIVAIRPRIGAYVVAAWMAGIILNLAINPLHYWDVAARDFGLMLGALSLGSLGAWSERHSGK